jgi:hypothetical protein
MTGTRGQRLKDARRKKFKSARSAATSLGIAVATYGAHERAQSPGGRDYGPDAARRYARQFDVTPEWLLTGYATAHDSANIPKQTKQPSTTKLRIIGYVGTAAQTYLYAVAPEDLEELELSKLITETTRVLEIRGNSMGSFYSDWLVLYDDLRETATPNLIGKLCVVGLADGRVLVKELQQRGAHGQFDLVSHAGPPIRNASIVWATIVKAMIPR